MRKICSAGMAENFVPLEVFLRPLPSAPAPPAAPEPVAFAAVTSQESVQTIRAARRFRAALSDALEVAVQQLLPHIARDVLARELKIEAADVGRIAGAALDRFAARGVVAIRAHPEDLGALGALEIEVIGDAALHRGDIILELHSGTIDLRMEARVEVVLAALSR
jgi:flagellar biosynthesis/type III secretory pathway protein FliH